MTVIIDAITHQLNGAHIARIIEENFSAGESSAQVICEVWKSPLIMNTVRVHLSKLFDQKGVKKQDRYGLRQTEPFPYSFEDKRPGRFHCIHVNIYHSERKVMARALDDAIMGLTL